MSRLAGMVRAVERARTLARRSLGRAEPEDAAAEPVWEADTRVDGSSPVFVVGSPRSGTSALAWALDAHPEFWTSEESDFLYPLAGAGRLHQSYRMASRRRERHWLVQQGVGFPEFAAFVGSGLDRLFLSRSGGKRWVDSSPQYTLMIPELLVLFPHARILHIVRNGADVVHSMLHSGFDPPWARRFAVACQTWVRFVTSGERARSMHPDRILQVRHEQLELDGEAAMAQILAFIGAEPDPSPARYLQSRRINSSFARTGPQPKDWTRRQSRCFLRVCGPTMRSFGYLT